MPKRYFRTTHAYQLYGRPETIDICIQRSGLSTNAAARGPVGKSPRVGKKVAIEHKTAPEQKARGYPLPRQATYAIRPSAGVALPAPAHKPFKAAGSAPRTLDKPPQLHTVYLSSCDPSWRLTGTVITLGRSLG